MTTIKMTSILLAVIFCANCLIAADNPTVLLNDFKNDNYISYDLGTNWVKLSPDGKVEHTTPPMVYLTDFKGDKYYSEDLGVTWIPYDAEPNSIEEHSFLSNIVVSPNPANATTTLTMELAQAGNLNIVVVDINGNNIMELHNANTSIGTFSKTFSLAGFANGAYFIKITHGNSIKMEKVIKE